MKHDSYNKIEIKKNHVYRPTGVWTDSVHSFLTFIKNKGLNCVPEPLGFDNSNREILSYIDGQISNYPDNNEFLSEAALISSAKLLRKFHDISKQFIDLNLHKNKQWLLKSIKPIEIICHGDFAPYNVTYLNDAAFGLIDFDAAHPGSRVWDVAYAAYRFSPLMNPEYHANCNNIEMQVLRLKLFLESYGKNQLRCHNFTQQICLRLKTLIHFMKVQSSHDEKYAAAIKNNDHIKYQQDIKYMKENRDKINKIFNGL